MHDENTVQVIMGTDGELSIEDFIVATMNQYRNLSDPVVAAMYRLMDTDDDGWVSAEDAFEALHPTGIHITVEELERLFDKYAVKRRIGQNAKECGTLPCLPHCQTMCLEVNQTFDVCHPQLSIRLVRRVGNTLVITITFQQAE